MNPSAALREFLETFLIDSRDGDRVPTSLELARKFGVAHSTVRRILGDYIRAGRMYGVRGLGTFAGSARVADPAGHARFARNCAGTFADLVVGQIRSGAIKTHRLLPSVKYMVEQFHVSPRTVVNAYRELQARGEVTRAGKRFLVGTPRSAITQKPMKPVLVVRYRNLGDETLFGKGHMARPFLSMERELQDEGYRLHTHLFNHAEALPALLDSLRPYAVLLYAPKDRGQLDATLARLQEFSKRSAGTSIPVLCIAHTRLISGGMPAGSEVQVLNTGNIATVQCRDCAGFIAKQGYRAATLWFDQKADEALIHQYLKIYPELLRLDREFSLRIAVDLQESGLDRFSAKVFAEHRKKRLKQILSKYTPLESAELESVVWGVRSFATALQRDRAHQIWVFAAGRHALQALQWSSEKKIDVPGSLAIVALENSVECAQDGITVSVPDWDEIGHLLAQVILGRPVQKSSKGFVRARAVTIERMTTATPK